jgi:NTE family protein
VDGGLVSPVPAREARAFGAACVIGVSLAIHDGRAGDPTNLFQVVTRAVSAVQKHSSENWEKQADLVVRPDVQELAWDDFARAEEAVAAGAAVMRRALPRVLQLLARREQIAVLEENPSARCSLSLTEALQ